MPSVKWDMSAHSHVRNISGVRDKTRRLRFSMGGVQLDFSVPLREVNKFSKVMLTD